MKLKESKKIPAQYRSVDLWRQSEAKAYTMGLELGLNIQTYKFVVYNEHGQPRKSFEKLEDLKTWLEGAIYIHTEKCI